MAVLNDQPSHAHVGTMFERHHLGAAAAVDDRLAGDLSEQSHTEVDADPRVLILHGVQARSEQHS